MNISVCFNPVTGAKFTLSETLYAFEDIIDGYFPLQVSLAQMMDRLGAHFAVINLSQAPIMEIPHLPHDAPVPLNIRAGAAGLITDMMLIVARQNGGIELRGKGDWSWLNAKRSDEELDPMTRLAEPAYVMGFCDVSGPGPGPRLSISPDDRKALRNVLKHLGLADSNDPANLFAGTTNITRRCAKVP